MMRVSGIRMGLAIAVAMGMAGIAYADGTEILGPPSIAIAEGSGIAVGGVGLKDGPASMEVDVPEGAEIKQVLLYWIGEFYEQTVGDPTVTVNGVEVTGQAIGGPTLFFSVVEFETYRADITDAGLVSDGLNTLFIDDFENSFGTTGAGVVVIYDDGGQPLEMELLDGLDLAYFRFEGTLIGEAVPLTFAFEPADYERIGNIVLHVGSVEEMRPNVTEVTMNGVSEQYLNLFTSGDGPEWDAQILPVTVPAGVDSLTVQIISASDGSENNPASLAWAVGGLAIEKPPVKEECDNCDDGIRELTLKYDGRWPTLVKVVQKAGHYNQKLLFCAYVRPGETFTVSGAAQDGSLASQIKIFANWCWSAAIPTDCSQPVGPGFVDGDFEVVSGLSLNGNELCAVEEPPAEEHPNLHGWLLWLFHQHLGKGGWGH